VQELLGPIQSAWGGDVVGHAGDKAKPSVKDAFSGIGMNGVKAPLSSSSIADPASTSDRATPTDADVIRSVGAPRLLGHALRQLDNPYTQAYLLRHTDWQHALTFSRYVTRDSECSSILCVLYVHFVLIA
jgi:hypothetical protein